MLGRNWKRKSAEVKEHGKTGRECPFSTKRGQEDVGLLEIVRGTKGRDQTKGLEGEMK